MSRTKSDIHNILDGKHYITYLSEDKMNVLENAFIKKYIDKSVANLQLIVPQLPEKYLRNFVEREVRKKVKDQNVAIQNTYTELNTNSTLLSIMHFLETEKPIVTGNGSFYVHHEEQVAPANNMLLNFRARRTEMKNEMFKCRNEGDDTGYIRNKLGQNNEKIKMNSYYGAMGQNSSFQYNVSCAGAITSQGRSIISTKMWFCETFLANNVIFDTFDDVFNYIRLICEEENHLEYYTYIEDVPCDDEIIAYLISKYEGKEDVKMLRAMLRMTLNKLESSTKIKIFYKNNLMRLIDRNKRIKNHIIDNIINAPIEWMDPNKVPKELDEAIEFLWDLVEEFVYMKEYIVYDKCDKYVNHERKVIVYSDTDSVFIYTGDWVFTFLKYIRGDDYQIYLKELEGEQAYVLKIINIFTRLIFVGIHKTFDTLTGNVNISKDYRKYVNTKNEFLMDRYIAFAGIKKNYIYREVVNEGNILNPPNFDKKGGNLNAKSKNKEVTSRINKIVEMVTMNYDKIYPEMLERETFKFRDEIIDSLKSGEMRFAAPVKVKDPSEYTNPYAQYKYLAVEAYRIATEDNSIDLPGSFNVVDVDMVFETGKKCKVDERIVWLKTNYPEIYNRLVDNYVADKNLCKHGIIKYIAFPMRMEKIPDWVLPFVDVDSIWRKHLNPLFGLYPSLGLRQDTIKGSTYYSTILSL